MELSERKLAANRANAAKSTGPRSPMGKIISSANSRRHKILASSVVLDNESASRFAAILNSFYADYGPRDATERVLVERMAIAHWRLMRIWAVEAADLRDEQNRQAGPLLLLDAPSRTAHAIRSRSNAERHPDPIGRRESRYSREFQTAYEALWKHRDREMRSEATELDDFKQPALEIEARNQPSEPTLSASEPILEAIEPTPKAA